MLAGSVPALFTGLLGVRRVVLVHVQTPQLPGKEAVTSFGTVESERIPAIADLTLTEFTIEPTLRITLFRKT